MARLAFSGAKRYRERGKGLLNRGVVYQNRDYNTKRRKVTFGKRSKGRGLDTLRSTVQRWQATSQSYLGPGRYRLASWKTDPITYAVPVHFMSLTNLGVSHGLSHPSKGCFSAVGMCRFSMDASGNFGWAPLACQDNAGGYSDATWKTEQDELPGDVTSARRIYHDWTDIRLNLYGTFSVPITYTVYVMQMKEQLDPFQYGSGPPYFPHGFGGECANMLKDMTRSLLCNSVNTNGRIDWYKDVRILRKERVTLQPLAYSDQVAELSGENVAHTPNIHELRMFIKHNRYRDYKWSENSSDTTYAVDLNVNQWDVNQPTANMCDVEWGKRVFLFITASCPQVGAQSEILEATSGTARTEGSYDVNIRNKFRFEN